MLSSTFIDDFALKKAFSSQATSDFYDLLIERHTRSSTIPDLEPRSGRMAGGL